MKFIVSLTTYPARIGTINQVIESLMRQTFQPDEIVLWLSREDFPEGYVLPANLDYAIDRGLKIRYVDGNLKPHKKYYYALAEYPDDIIVTVDDDAIYPSNLLEELHTFHLKFPTCVVATRVRMIKTTEDRRLCPYLEWNYVTEIVGRPGFGLLPIGLGGVLYPPHVFHKAVQDKQAIVDLCINADDIWLKFMQLLNGVKVVATHPIMMMPEYVKDSQKTSLWSSNKTSDGNDLQIKALVEYCDGIMGEKFIEGLLHEHRDEFLVSEADLGDDIPVRSTVEPRISVVLPVYNVESYIEECIASLQNQRVKDIEIICVDDGSTDGTAEKLRSLSSKDDRIGVVWKTNHGAGVARNVGLEKARGEYVFFCDPDDFCDVLMLDKLYRRAKASDCDVVFCGRRLFDDNQKRFTGAMLFSQFQEAFQVDEISERIFNSFGYVPWNKIVRRSMLMEFGIRFQDLPRNNDIYFSNAVLVASKRIGVVNEPLYAYRTNRGGSLQTAIDTTPDTNIQAFRATYEFMKRCGKTEAYGDSFRRMVWVEAIVRLAAFKTRDAAEDFYSRLCGEWLVEFGLEKDFEAILAAAYLPAARAVVSHVEFNAYLKADEARRLSRMPKDKDALLAIEKKKVADRDKWLANEKKKVADRDKWLAEAKNKVVGRDKLLTDIKIRLERTDADLRKARGRIGWCEREIAALKASTAYRVGMFITWPARKAWGVVKCFRENGFCYTAKHSVGKCLRFCGSKVKW